MLRKMPIVAIIGSTGTGKTKLSIELAKRFNGEIISADSMQVYRGLDISAGKATRSEQAQAPHHMLDVCDKTTESFTVHEFRDAVLPIVDRLQNTGRMPVIVGGTTFYVESIIWKVLVPSPRNTQCTHSDSNDAHTMERQGILTKLSPDELKNKDTVYLHEMLAHVDPESAQRLHPNNSRGVHRALEVYMNTGKTMSQHLAEQKLASGSSPLGGPLRYENVILLWLKSDQAKLDARIDARIDGMIAQGLVYELRKCFNDLRDDMMPANKLYRSIGMMRAIGLKEFVPYLQKYRDERIDAEITEFIKSHGGLSGSHSNIDAAVKPDGLETLELCLEDLRMRTKRFSREQVARIHSRFVCQNGRAAPPMYVLDASNAESAWNSEVYAKAEHVVEAFIEGIEPTKIRPVERLERKIHRTDVTYFCEICDRRFVGDLQWSTHLTSNVHAKVAQKRTRIFQRLIDTLESIKNRS